MLGGREALTLLPSSGSRVVGGGRAKVRPEEIVALTLAIVAINGWNRCAVGLRSPVGHCIAPHRLEYAAVDEAPASCGVQRPSARGSHRRCGAAMGSRMHIPHVVTPKRPVCAQRVLVPARPGPPSGRSHGATRRAGGLERVDPSARPGRGFGPVRRRGLLLCRLDVFNVPAARRRRRICPVVRAAPLPAHQTGGAACAGAGQAA
jgi:hypothetical protein